MEYPQIMKRVTKIVDSSAGTLEQSFCPTPLSYTKYNLDPNWTSLERRISNLNLEVHFLNLPVTPFPEEMTTKYLSQWEENLMLRDNEWKSDNRILGQIVEREDPSSAWRVIGEISLSNRGGIPFTHPGFLRATKALGSEVFLGDTQDLGIRLRDVGAGLIKGGDKLIITGIYIERAFIPDEGKNITAVENFSWNVLPTATNLFTATANIAFFRIYNNGTSRIWLNYGEFVGVGAGDPLQVGESRQVVNKLTNEYKFVGDVWAVAEGNNNQQVSGVVGYR